MHDVIVIGVGTFGAAASDALARRGVSVLGLEQFTIPHNRGSHHGKSRMFRFAYYEHPNYVPLLQRAYAGWQELEQRSATRLYHDVGALYLGRREGELIAGSVEAARRHGLEHRELSAAELASEYPQFRLPRDHVGFLEAKAGFVLPELAVEVMAAQAAASGATILDRQQVLGWDASDGRVSVRTADALHEAKSLIVTAGAWTSRLIADLGVPLVVTRQVLGWVQPSRPDLFRGGDGGSSGSGFPCWAIGYEDGSLHYGFPMMESEETLKIALHARGRAVDPDRIHREVAPEEEASFRSVIDRFMPAAAGPTVKTCVCMYTNSPDSHFIIDKHPEHSNVVFGCGFSGHGFKFAPVIGEALADLAVGGATKLPIEFLSMRRFKS